MKTQLPVTPPYRLDLTVEALRRLAANVVDVFDGEVYRRALQDERGTTLLAVRQPAPDTLAIEVSGRKGERWMPTVRRMLGTDVDLASWRRRAARIGWLRPLAREFNGVRPPRYPSLWEALAHSIVFQQISLHAAASIMRRLVERLSEPVEHCHAHYYPFPRTQALLSARESDLRACGLSANKVAHLRSAANAVSDGRLAEEELALLPTPSAALRLREVRGIGPWSAAVVLLRGLGRLDAFPLKDSGVARSIRLLSGDPHIDADAVLDALGPVRGMLYFHLLLGRLRNHRVPGADSKPV